MAYDKVPEPPRTLQSEIIRLGGKYGVDPELATAIITCESGLKEDAVHVNIVDNHEWSRDIGYFQLNNYFHGSDMEKRGLDIKDKWDNLEYGFYLLKVQGTNPWVASKPCWSKLSTVTIKT